MGIKELKEYALHSPPWFDTHGSCCVDPEFGISPSFIKDRIKIKVPFSKVCDKFPATKIEYDTKPFDEKHEQDSPFAETLSFVSQDGLIFHLFGTPEGDSTWIWQVYFDDNYKYPPNIKDARKESTAFKKWLLAKI